MDISLNWLRRYVDLQAPPEELARALTALGFEVEARRTAGEGVEGVVVAQVLTCGRHPDADRLSVCTVTDGSETLPVVCGAPNVAAGQKVLLARAGATLPGGVKIKKGKLRGQESHGMICAADELGLGDDHSGILVLPAEVPAGTPFRQVPGLCDTVFTVNITPNRPDALCHLGVARELAAHYRLPLRAPEPGVREGGGDIADLVSLEVLDPGACGKYLGRVIRGVTVGKSPDWLVQALAAVGQKSVNNVVDATNFVLLALGQPSHAFDLDKLRGRKVAVRRARAGEALRTLDHQDRSLSAEDLAIADGEGAICLAGVMGGEGSEVGEGTRDVFLEVAYFRPDVVRRQARRHGLSTDSSYRFERGVDPLAQAWVMEYLADLVVGLAGGSVARGVLSAEAPDHPKSARTLGYRLDRGARILGVDLPEAEVVGLLEGIGLRRAGGNVPGTVTFEIPGFRQDLKGEADLAEEVARLHGLDRIPAKLPSLPLAAPGLPPMETLRARARAALAAQGLNEAVNLRFLSPKALAKLGLDQADPRSRAVRLLNPLSEDWALLPTTLLPGLLAALGRNQRAQERGVRLFEVGKAFQDRPEARQARGAGVDEDEKLAMAIWGEWLPGSWASEPVEAGFFHLKGALENLFERLRVEARWPAPASEPFLHPRESGEIRLGPAPIGTYGTLHPKVVAAFELKGPVYVAELSLTALAAAPRAPSAFREYGAHMTVTRDVNLIVDDGLEYSGLVDRMPLGKLKFFQELRLNSVYRGAGVPEGKKAMHFTFAYREPSRTLTDDEVNGEQDKLRAALAAHPDIALK